MLYVRFLAGAGGVLLALMLVANAYLPQPAAPAPAGDDAHPTIRITSTRKGPERVVFDTSLPTTAAPPSPAVADLAPSLPPAPAREAFAQVSDRPAERAATTAAKPPAARPARRHAARRSPEPPPMALQPRQFAGGFFPFWFR